MVDEDRGGDQLLGAGERAVGFGEPALHRPVRGGIGHRRVRAGSGSPSRRRSGRWRRTDRGGARRSARCPIRPSIRRSDRCGRRRPAAAASPPRGRRARRARRSSYIGCWPRPCGSIQMTCQRSALLVMAFVDVPEADVGRVLRVEAVQIDHGRPGAGRIIVRRQIGAAELGRAVDLVDPAEADEAGRTDAARRRRPRARPLPSARHGPRPAGSGSPRGRRRRGRSQRAEHPPVAAVAHRRRSRRRRVRAGGGRPRVGSPLYQGSQATSGAPNGSVALTRNS